ncbi:MAG TPA: hypothetical protein VIK81_00305 [Patescibacteria group bacterium]
MKNLIRPIVISITVNLLTPAVVFAQTSTSSASKGATSSSLPSAGNPTVTAILVVIALVLILIGANRFFSSYR